MMAAVVMTMAAAAATVAGADVRNHRAQNDQHQSDFREQLHNVLLAKKSHGRETHSRKPIGKWKDGKDA